MKPREILAEIPTPDGKVLQLAREAGHLYVIRLDGIVLMSSARSGSEREMARIAKEILADRRDPAILVGGLGIGYTAREALDAFDRDARITIAELLAPLVELNRGVLADLADRPLDDPRITVVVGDVRDRLEPNRWDAVLLDVDNGPDAFTVRGNDSLYGDAGTARFARTLTRGGVLVVWSAFADREYERRLRRAGLRAEMRRVHARADAKKGGKHVLFVATKS